MAVKSSKDAKDEGAPFEEETKMEQGNADTITPEHLQIIEDLRDQLSDLQERVLASEERDVEEGRINPAEDYLEDPITFFAFSWSYAIHGDKRHGVEVLPPYEEPVKFEKLYRYKRPARTGRGVQIVSVSQAIVRSKALAEWLRGHSLFNIKFFENIKTAQNVNVTLAEKMAEANSVVMNMSDMAAMERAKREGIDINNPDPTYIRQMLTRKLAEDAIKRDAQLVRDRISGERDEEGRQVE